MIKRHSPRFSFISSIFGFTSGRSSRGRGLGRLQLFGLSGTLGHGVERHCDTWNVGEPTPDQVTVRKGMQEMAHKRRAEANERIGEQKKKGFYDFNSR